MQDRGNRKKGRTLNHLHGMLCTNTTMNAPTINMTLCWVMGPQWSPLLYVSVLAALNTSTTEIRQRNRV